MIDEEKELMEMLNNQVFEDIDAQDKLGLTKLHMAIQVMNVAKI